jgi:hypothetical protein
MRLTSEDVEMLIEAGRNYQKAEFVELVTTTAEQMGYAVAHEKETASVIERCTSITAEEVPTEISHGWGSLGEEVLEPSTAPAAGKQDGEI